MPSSRDKAIRRLKRRLRGAVRRVADTPPTLGPGRRRQIVQSLIAANVSELDELPTRKLLALQPALEHARRTLAEELRDWMANVPEGELRWTAQHRRNVLVRVEAAMRRLDHLRTVRAGLEDALQSGRREVAGMSLRHLQEELATFGQIFEGSIQPVNFDLAADLELGDQQLIPRYRTSAARYATNIRADIRRTLSLAVLRKETFHQTTSRLVKTGGPRGLVALRGIVGEPGAYAEWISEGLFRRYRYWAERIVRTELIHAYNAQHEAGIREAHDQDPTYRKRWDAALDRRVCAICRGLDGQIVGVDEAFSGGVRHAPAHPNCRCTVVPWKLDWPEFLNLSDTHDQQPAVA